MRNRQMEWMVSALLGMCSAGYGMMQAVPVSNRSPAKVDIPAVHDRLQTAWDGARQARLGRFGTPIKPRIERPSLAAKSPVPKVIPDVPPGTEIARNETNGTAVFIKGPDLFASAQNGKISDVSLTCLQAYRSYLKIRNAFEEFRVITDRTDERGFRHVKLQQEYGGVPLSGREILVHINGSGCMYLIEGRTEPTPNLDVNPVITSDRALEIVRAQMGELDPRTTCELVIHYDGLGLARLAWEIRAVAGMDIWKYFVDARTGRIIIKYPDVRHASVSGGGTDSYGQAQTFPVWQSESKYYLVDTTQAMHLQDPMIPSSTGKGNVVILTYNGVDPTVNANGSVYFISSSSTTSGWNSEAAGVYANLRTIQDYWRTTFNRSSIDTQGLNTIGVIDCGGTSMRANAGWYPSLNMILFGQGGSQMDSMAKALDYTAHEFTHGITSYTANMEYMYQSGALNEAMSDIFACMIDSDDWTMGEDIVYVQPGWGRSLQSPHDGLESLQAQQQGIGLEPESMSEYRNLPSSVDNGGVHINSTIPSHAAYLMAEGLGTQSIGREATAKIFYQSLTQHLTRQSNFSDARRATIQSAEELYGAGSTQVQGVTAAWDAVGVTGTDGTGTGQGTGQTAPVQGSENIVFIYQNAGLKYLGVHTQDGQEYQVSTHPVIETRPVVVNDGGGVLFVDATNNLRLAALDPYVVFDEAVTTDGYVRTIAGSQDGRYFAFTTTDLDAKLFLLDMDDDTGNSNKTFDLYLPSDANVNTISLEYAEVMDFDLSGKRIIFDALSEINLGDTQETYQVWSIGILDLSTSQILSLVPGQPQGIQIGNPTAANTMDWLVAVDVWDMTTKEYKTQTVNLTTGQAGLVAMETDPASNFGWASFNGDDTAVAIQYQNNIVTIPLTQQSGTFTGDTANTQVMVNTAYYPRYYRVGTRDVTPKIQATPGIVEFGVVAVGETSSQTVTIGNSGAYDLTVETIAVGDTENFSFAGSHTTLAPGATAAITVTFNPTSTGAKTTYLTVTSDDPVSPTLTVALRGGLPAGGTTDATNPPCCGAAPLLILVGLYFFGFRKIVV